MFRRQISEKIISTISKAWHFTTKSGGICQELHRAGLQLSEPYTCHGSCLLSLYGDVRGASYQKESGINSAQLLIDETRGRELAIARGLEVLGSLRILGEAKRGGLIPAVRPISAELLAARYWIDEEVIRVFLQEMGEEALT